MTTTQIVLIVAVVAVVALLVVRMSSGPKVTVIDTKPRDDDPEVRP